MKKFGERMAVIAGLTFALVLAGCSSGLEPESPPTTANSSANETQLVDPLLQIADPNSDRFIAKGIVPSLHVKGEGPTEYDIERPPTNITQIRFYVACQPDSKFTVTMEKFFSGPCAGQYQNTGGIPISPGDGSLKVSLDIPDGVEYWLVGIPIE